MTFDLSGSVGRRGANRYADVRAVQVAMQTAAGVLGIPSLHPGLADGYSGDGTEGALASLQRLCVHARNPDARLDPGGRTEAVLSRIVALDGAGWTFPLHRSATAPYVGAGAGMRAFRASRSSGKRAHAACDLYAPVGTPVLAVAPGRVLGIYPFYLRTNEVQVEHRTPAGVPYVVRYGEVDPKALVRVGQTVERGEIIARVGQMIYKSGGRFPYSMLHVELFLGLDRGALTRKYWGAIDRVHGRPFQRRPDLCDPSAMLRRAPLPR